ncbi:MAG: class I SAM-dependent methyltransferase [Acidimicrobiales bacterium]
MSTSSPTPTPSSASRATPPWRQRLATAISIRTQRRRWTDRAGTWDQHNDAGMAKVAAAAVDAAHVQAGMRVVDLGCGGGRLALELARHGAVVVGVDVSDAMIARMTSTAADEGITTVTGVVSPVERLSLPDASVDLVISNYALHHLRDADKAKVVRAAYRWLRPGGQLINADMMLGRGATAQDRQVIAGKIKVMARKGLPGYWRIAKNAGRYLLRVHERPITPEAWSRLYEQAGFVDVSSVNVVAEANIVRGVKPGA